MQQEMPESERDKWVLRELHYQGNLLQYLYNTTTGDVVSAQNQAWMDGPGMGISLAANFRDLDTCYLERDLQ